MDRRELFENISKKIQYGVGVEVGTFRGEFSKSMLEIWNGTLYMVDVWRGMGEEYDDISNHKNHTNIWEDAMNNIEPFYDRAIMIRTNSKNASKLFQDNSIDFAYIDANHSYDFVREDIELWYPKIKTGGYLWGHDYLKIDWRFPPFADNGKDKYIWSNDGNPNTPLKYAGIFGVNPAVDEFCEKEGYAPIITDEWAASWCICKK
jgi:hypothetical protein